MVERPKLKDATQRAHAFAVRALIDAADKLLMTARVSAQQGDLPSSLIGTIDLARKQTHAATYIVVDQLATYVPGEDDS